MWRSVRDEFSKQVVRSEIVRKMIQCGMRVSDDMKIYVGDVEVDYTAVARAVDVDRRVVKQTVEQIRKNRHLYSLFTSITPLGASLANVVSQLGYSAIEIGADARSPGVMAAVAEILSRNGLVIRQALADDPDMVVDAKMTVVVEGRLSGETITELNELSVVRSLKILK